jgi:P-loop Domain of unknown function (DUF2791)
MGKSERATWADHIVASRLQTLLDVALARMGTVAVIAGDEETAPVVDALAESALANGFAVASASLADHGLQDLHALVGALAASLRGPSAAPGRRNGLVAALDRFAHAHGRSAEAIFEESAEEEQLGGELSTLAREYIASASGNGPARKLQAWLGGRDIAKEAEELRPLSARTAKRALADLTRLVRALGHRGTRVLLRDAEALVDLSPGRRDVAYTVLREIVDNADGRHGVVGCETLLIGTGDLDRRVHSLLDHPALASRVVADLPPGPPIPHQTWLALRSDDPTLPLPPVPELHTPSERSVAQLAALVRITQGLPPLEAVPDLTIGMQEVDRRIEQLFETASNDGSVFAVLLGEYGSGKTHHLLHLESRARADRRPVLRLAVERLDEDLGNPQRHMRRLLENAILPGRRAAGFLEQLDHWLAKPATRKRLRRALDAIVEARGDAARPAARAIGDATEDDLDDDGVRETLGALDLVDKPNNPSYRKDAYARLHLWLDVLARLEECEGPVLILDEAENLYRVGVSRAERRTALRSLAHYCGGALPRATVVLAVTPETLEALRDEAGELLEQIEEQTTLLPSEDVAMLRHRLLRARPIRVTKLDRDALESLAEQARRLARGVRGKHVDRGVGEFLERAMKECATPRELLRRVMLREERIAWLEDAGDR